jgi:Icc-related predicted phosphoesterase
MANEHSLMNKYMKIPLNTDVIVSHTPPWGDVGGMTLRAIDAGSLALRLRIEQMIPDLVVCGHIHEGYGQHVIPLANGMVVDVQNVAQMDLTYSPVNPPVWVEW